MRRLGGADEVQVEQTWEDALHRPADMSKEMPDLFVALSKRLEPRDLASIVQMASGKAPQLLKSLNPRFVASVFEHLDPAISAEVLEEFDVKTSVYIVENMSIERAVDVLQHAGPPSPIQCSRGPPHPSGNKSKTTSRTTQRASAA